MILKDDTVLLRDFKREDIAKRIEWETEQTEWQLWPVGIRGADRGAEKRESAKVHKSVGGMGGDM